jgi:MFS family permease
MLSSPRAAVSAAFLIHSTVSGTWAPRLPAIKESLGLSDGELGTALVGLAIGLLVGTRLAGAPVDRFGSRPVMRVGFPLLAATLVLPGLADSIAALFLALFVLGLASGALDVAMNAQGIEVERQLGRPILSGLHGLWSIGLGIGAGVAALAAAIDAEPLEQFAVVAAVLAVASLVFLRGLLAAHRPEPGEPAEERVTVRWTLPLVLLGVIAFCSFVGEGSASDWSAVYMTQELGSSQALGAVAFAAFAVTMAVARFAVDPLRGRLGNVVLVRGGSTSGGHRRIRAARPRPGARGPDRIQRSGRPRPPRHRPPGGPSGNARLRGLGGRPDHDWLAGGGHEPAALARPGGAAGAGDSRVGAKGVRLRTPTNWRTDWLRSRPCSSATATTAVRAFIRVAGCRRPSARRASNTTR